ncbi:hypothetical protein ACRAWD_31715 [Caulobacter segnis]
MAPDLGWALAMRLVQGVFGGVMPTFMMLLVMTSPLQGRARIAGLAVFSIAASIGLGFAASVAAWLIELGGWRGLFWGQAMAGLLYTALAFLVLEGDRGDPCRLRTTDWGGYGLLSLALGLLLVGISEGERHFWFEAWWITAALRLRRPGSDPGRLADPARAGPGAAAEPPGPADPGLGAAIPALLPLRPDGRDRRRSAISGASAGLSR